MKPELLQSLIERASAEELGIVIETNNYHRLEQEFAKYAPMKSTEFILARLDDTHLALIRKSVELDYDLSGEQDA